MLKNINKPLAGSRTLFSYRQGKAQHFKISRRLKFSPELLFSIISDVPKYKEFVPFVIDSYTDELDTSQKYPTKASLRVGWNQFDESFTCKLECIENKLVKADSVSTSVFEYLSNEWRLKEVKSRFSSQPLTIIELVLKYKFRNPLYNSVSSLFHDQISQTMMKAFENRAMEIKLDEELKQ